MREFIAVTKALASEQRVRIVMALREGELCEGVIAELLGLTESSTSRHLWVLRQAGLVESEKTGQCVCYRLGGGRGASIAAKALKWLRQCLALEPQMVEDARRAGALSARSAVEAECCERRERQARRWRELGSGKESRGSKTESKKEKTEIWGKGKQR